MKNYAGIAQFQPEADPPMAEVKCNPDTSGLKLGVLKKNEKLCGNSSVGRAQPCQG